MHKNAWRIHLRHVQLLTVSTENWFFIWHFIQINMDKENLIKLSEHLLDLSGQTSLCLRCIDSWVFYWKYLWYYQALTVSNHFSIHQHKIQYLLCVNMKSKIILLGHNSIYHILYLSRYVPPFIHKGETSKEGSSVEICN